MNPYSFVSLIHSAGLLTASFYIVKFNPKKRLALITAVTGILISLYLAFITLARNSNDPMAFSKLSGLAYSIGLFGITSWTFIIVEYAKSVKGSNIFNNIFLVSSYLVSFLASYLFLFTNFFFNFSNPVKVNNHIISKWLLKPNTDLVIIIAFIALNVLVAVYNLLTAKSTIIQGINKSKLTAIFFGAGLLGTVSLIFLCTLPFLSFKFNFPLEFIGELALLFSHLLILFLLGYNDIYILDQIIFIKRFKIEVISSLLRIFLLIWIIFLVLKFFALVPAVTIILFLFVLDSWVKDYFLFLFENISKRGSIESGSITKAEVGYALRNINRLDALRESSLLNLNIIRSRSKSSDIYDKCRVLKELICELVSDLKPIENTNRRTQQLLKYEILKMIIFENAKESQILWDLGFDCNSKRPQYENVKPRFAITSNSEYASTSIPSFRRLKMQAIEDLITRLKIINAG